MATTPERERLREEEEIAVGPLLARAKLFRVRGQWDEAIAACTDVLRRYPVSVTACSLLGEIYEAQGRLDDAIQWYGMALEKDSNSNSDRAGLERVTALKAKQNPAPEAPPVVPPTSSPRPVTEKTLEWFDKLFPPGDSRSIARMLYAVSGVIGVLLLVSGIAFYIFFQNNKSRDVLDLPPPGTANSGLPAPATPVVVEPTVHVKTTPKPSPSPSEAPNSGTPATPTGESDESRVLREINRQLASNFVVQAIRREGPEGNVAMELLVPAGETAEKSRELVLRDTAIAVRFLGQMESSFQTASVRVSMPNMTNGTTQTSVFSGDISVSAVREGDLSTLSYMDILSKFSRLQWEGPLVPNTGGNENPNQGNSPLGNASGIGGQPNGQNAPSGGRVSP